jgi:hypothetical protein
MRTDIQMPTRNPQIKKVIALIPRKCHGNFKEITGNLETRQRTCSQEQKKQKKNHS